MIASGMVACTFISAPIMFISARMLSVKSFDPSDYINQLDTFLLDISIVRYNSQGPVLSGIILTAQGL